MYIPAAEGGQHHVTIEYGKDVQRQCGEKLDQERSTSLGFSHTYTGNLINENGVLEQGRNISEQAKDWQLDVLPVRASCPFPVHSQHGLPCLPSQCLSGSCPGSARPEVCGHWPSASGWLALDLAQWKQKWFSRFGLAPGTWATQACLGFLSRNNMIMT